MTRHSPAEIVLMVLAVCGAVAILSMIVTGLLRLAARSTPVTGGIGVSVGGITAIVFSVLLIALVAVVVAVSFALRSKR